MIKINDKEKSALEYLAQNKMTVSEFCDKFGNLVFTSLYQNGLIEPDGQTPDCNEWYIEVA
jgi:hypothetical protein